MGREMRSRFVQTNQLLAEKMCDALEKEHKALKGVDSVGEGERKRFMNVTEGCAISFVEALLYRHNKKGHVDNIRAKTALLNLYLMFEMDDRTLEQILREVEVSAINKM